MKYGYLEFRYNHRRSFMARTDEPSDVTINIGDNIQSLAIRRLLVRLGIDDADIIGINRDDLPNYKGEPVMLMMNGCFNRHCFPLPANIHPVFFGFNTNSEPMIRSYRAYLKKFEPIGCRDEATRQLLDANGIESYVSGCLTLTFEKRIAPPENGRAVIAFGRGAGELPGSLLEKIPAPILQNAALIYQRETVKVLPLNSDEIQRADAIACSYLDFYANKASLVITPLLHAASPCLGMGIPVILARKDSNSRFSAINKLIPLHTPDYFQAINWNPGVVDMEPVKESMTRIVARLVKRQPADTEDIALLMEIYSRSPQEGSLPAAKARISSSQGIRKWFPWLRRS